MHVERIGSGEVSLVLHGFAGSSGEMMPLASRLPGRKLVPDLPGHGATGPMTGPADYEFEVTIARLLELVEAERVEQADVVGYSMGGRLALGVAAAMPSLIRSVAVIGARSGIENDAERGARVARDDALAKDILERGIDWFAEQWTASWLYDTQRRVLGDDHMLAVAEIRRSNDPEGLANSLRIMGAGAQPVITSDLIQSGVPAILIVGEHDDRFGRIAADLAADVPRARVVTISGVGHAAHVEDLDATVGAIIEFWEGTG